MGQTAIPQPGGGRKSSKNQEAGSVATPGYAVQTTFTPRLQSAPVYAPRLALAIAQTPRGSMTQARCNVPARLRMLALAALMGASFGVHADDYGDVTQLLRQGKTSEALSKADQYLAGKPKDPQMRFIKGVIQSEAGKPNDAIATFVALTQEYPELPEPYNNLAVLYASQNQYDKARTALEMAIRTNPSYATAHENLGDVYAKLASQAYSKALQLDNTNPAIQPKLALIRDLFTTNGKPGAASKPTAAPAPAPAPAPVAAAPKAAPAPAPSPAPERPLARLPRVRVLGPVRVRRSACLQRLACRWW